MREGAWDFLSSCWPWDVIEVIVEEMGASLLDGSGEPPLDEPLDTESKQTCHIFSLVVWSNQ